MQTDKPLISILMAVYEPRMDWLREQLDSLEAQTYPNLRLYIRDDCSPTVPLEAIEACARAGVKRIPFTIARNERNLGSNRTFERLTREAEGEYFAYCDQDDVWLADKLTVLQAEIERSNALLVCSDMYVMNGGGEQTADSITKLRRRHRFRSGSDLTESLLISNFASGCAMLVRGEAARAAIPFCPYMVHDHYIALCCSAAGRIESIPQRLIRYRVHDKNQTGVLKNVTDKASYRRERIELPLQKFCWLEAYFPYRERFGEAIRLRIEWMRARRSNWDGQGGARMVWKYRGFSPLASLFELFGRRLPAGVLRWLVRRLQTNRL